MPEGIFDLLLLVEKLAIVGKVLPFTASANPEVLAESFCTLVRVGVVVHHPCLHVTSFLSEYLEVCHISGDGFFYKNHHVIDPGQ